MKLKKLLLLGVAMVAATAVLAGCGNDKTASSAKPAGQKIIIGLDDNFPPMGFHDKSGKIVGFDIDLSKAVAKKLGDDIEFKPIDWAAKEAELDSGRITAIWNGLTITPAREKKILFSKPYMNNDQIVVVPANSPIQNMEQLKGKVVGVQDGSSSYDALEANKAVASSLKSVKKYGDNVTALIDAKTGRIDAVVVDSIVGRYYLKQKPGQYRILPGNLGREKIAVGLKKGNTELANKINKALDELRKDGTMKKISEKWFGKDVTI